MDLVKKARALEMEFVKERQIYEYRPVAECIKKTGKPPVGTKWLDTNKGDDEQPLVRSRLVAMEFKRSWIAKWFAATPPMEAVRVLLVIAAAGCSEGQPPRKLLHIDVSRAHWYPKAKRDVYVKLPPEDPRGGDATICGKLLKTMYGTLDAAQRWSEDYLEKLLAAGFTKGMASPCHLFHAQRNLYTVVWGDDFLCVADDADLKWMEQLMKSHYECKSIWVGPGADCVQEARVLGRIVTYCSWGIQYEADPTLAERLVRDCGLENANPVTTPWADDAAVAQATASASETRLPLDSVRKAVGSQKHLELDPVAAQGSSLEESPELDEQRAKAYKSLAAVLNFLPWTGPICSSRPKN